MASVLVLILNATAGDGVVWARRAKRRGPVETGAVDLDAPLPRRLRADTVCVIVPGLDVASHRVPATKGSPTQARSAALFAVEDDIALDLDSVHLALTPRSGEERFAAVVSKDRMDSWLEMLAVLEVEPDCITPDFFALPRPAAQTLRLSDLGDRVLVDFGDFGLAADPDLASVIVPAACEDREFEAIEARTNRAANLGVELLRAYGPVQTEQPLDREALLSLFVDAVDEGPRLNLLQGAYQGRPPWRRAAGALRGPAILAGVALVAWLALLMAETAAYKSAARDARDETANLYAQTFPNDGAVIDVGARMREQLRSAQGESSGVFLDLSAALAEALSGAPNVELQVLRFTSGDDELEATLRYRSFQDIEALTASLSATNAIVEVGSERRENDRFVGSITLRAAP